MNWNKLANPAVIVAVVILVSAAAGLGVLVRAMDIYIQKLPIDPPNNAKFHTIPVELPSWERLGADPPALTGEVLEALGTSNYLSRWYIQTEHPEDEEPWRLELHTAYYTGAIDSVPHVPERCYVGGGMSISGQSQIVPLPIDLERFPPDPSLRGTEWSHIRRGRLGPTSSRPGAYVRMPRDLENLSLHVTKFSDPNGRSLFAGYFFLANGGAVPSAYDVRQLAFTLKDTYSYYAKVQFMSDQAQSPEQLARMAAEFLNEMFPEIMLRVPDWVEVKEGRYPPAASSATVARAESR
ncbi:MAG: exosortase-associated EpsI family protein [Planctomycetota bacterium]|nr:exosortase-associated EpsI family protein [Planctomycetota bacterium]